MLQRGAIPVEVFKPGDTVILREVTWRCLNSLSPTGLCWKSTKNNTPALIISGNFRHKIDGVLEECVLMYAPVYSPVQGRYPDNDVMLGLIVEKRTLMMIWYPAPRILMNNENSH